MVEYDVSIDGEVVLGVGVVAPPREREHLRFLVVHRLDELREVAEPHVERDPDARELALDHLALLLAVAALADPVLDIRQPPAARVAATRSLAMSPR